MVRPDRFNVALLCLLQLIARRYLELGRGGGEIGYDFGTALPYIFSI